MFYIRASIEVNANGVGECVFDLKITNEALSIISKLRVHFFFFLDYSTTVKH
ncbi:hypothetical protein PanWU01x14_239660 [Parasponia andersonii]|uniref:Uncharacterized protein n=1 Tax=Parasponia andersonii TaxID=3476 RepID=A0A2P5BH36_PARAD|nr:hypothetical protein PanWU01x14_239660 [Parasponia andersonii]